MMADTHRGIYKRKPRPAPPGLELGSHVLPAAAEVLRDGERLAAMYATRTQDELAQELGIGHDSLRRALRYHRVPIRPRGQRVERDRRALTREGLRRLVWGLYDKAGRCPPDCPGRPGCLDPGGECIMGEILEGKRQIWDGKPCRREAPG
jgi:hypothetical protein